MDNFDDLLKKSLSIVNDAYQQTKTDIFQVIDSLRASIKANAGEDFSVELAEVGSGIKGVTYQIYLDTDVNDARASIVSITHLYIPSKGYPVQLGGFNKSTENFIESGKILNNKNEVQSYFAGELSNPDSRLIQGIGFALRRRAGR